MTVKATSTKHFLITEDGEEIAISRKEYFQLLAGMMEPEYVILANDEDYADYLASTFTGIPSF